jgi:hypothetical protein
MEQQVNAGSVGRRGVTGGWRAPGLDTRWFGCVTPLSLFASVGLPVNSYG